MKQSNLNITDIQHFCMHDGPGLRTVVFLKGCPLHCKWCHNPETQNIRKELMFVEKKCISCGACVMACPNNAQSISPVRFIDRKLCVSCGKCVDICQNQALSITGKTLTVDEIINDVVKDSPFYGNDGGLTISGGEPTFQADGLIELLKKAKGVNIHTCIETCGIFNDSLLNDLLSLVDMFLYDIKDTNEKRLYKNTKADLNIVLNNLHKIDDAGIKTVLRCILIPEINLNDEHLYKIADIYKSLKNCLYVELLPYHPYGISKSEQLGFKKESLAIYTKPERKTILDFATKLQELNVRVKCYGSQK